MEAGPARDGMWRGPLRVLLASSSEGAERLLAQLRSGGYEPSAHRVDSSVALSEAVQRNTWDVAICEDDLPTLDGPTALKLIKTDCPWLPVIIVSSRFGESVAAAAMKAGADDFVASGFLARLVPAVEREIRAASLRRGWKETAQGLADARLRSTAFMDNNPAVAFLKDEEGRLVYVNRTFERSLGISFESVRGKSDAEWLPAGLAEQTRAHDEAVLAADRPMEFEESLPAGGDLRHWLIFKFTVRDHSGKRFVGGVGIDVTERRRAEVATRASETRYRTLFERNLAGVYRSSREGQILECNDAFARIYGYGSREEILAVPTQALYPDPRQRAEFLEALARNGVLTNYEGGGRRQDGSAVWTLENAALLPGEAGEGDIIEGTIIDVTDRRHLEAQLRQAQKMEAVGRLAGGVAHDFNNLLTAILGYSELLLTQLRPDDPLREDAEEIRKAGERAADLTRQLLAFSRKQRLEPRVLDINLLVGDLQKMLRRTLGEDIELVASLAPDVGRVRADPGQLEQVIVNLAVNARDAMTRGGRLTIETSNAQIDPQWGESFPVRPGPYVMIAIADTGTGMTDETKSHLFEPFFTTKGQGKGTGLGLATVYGIVKQSGGYIWVYSEPDAGTVFRIYLPRLDEAVLSTPSDSNAAGESRRGHETVLLVEDEEGVRALARRILSAQGYAVLEAPGPERALELLEQHQGTIHLLLTDVVMPDMNGSELASRAATLRPGVKVLFMSGYSDDAMAGRGLIAEGGHFLQKPFTPDGLASTVREVLDSAPGVDQSGR